MAGERRGVDDRLGDGLAAVEQQARQRVAVVAAKARPAVARRHADRAEEPQVVEVHDDGRPRGARLLERARPEQRERVVEVDDVGAERPRRRGDVVLVAAASEQRERGGGP